MNSRFAPAPTVAANLRPSPTLAINEEVTRLWAAGRTVYHLGFGESRFPAHPRLVEALAAHAHANAYLPTLGLPALRAAIADFHSCHFEQSTQAEQVIVGPGSKPLIFAVQMALDADLLLPTPSWVSYAPQARLLGRRVLPIPARAADDWALTPDALAATAARSSNATKLLVLNSPNNPTGQMIAPAQMAAICAACRDLGILILSDEIYALTAHGGVPFASSAQYYPEGTVVLGGLSKHLSLGGWRLGHAVVPAGDWGRTLQAALRVIAGEIWSAPAAPIQHAAVVAYSGDPAIEAYIGECTALHALRTRYLHEWLIEFGIPTPPPAGGFYLFPAFDRWRDALAARGVYSAADLAQHLLAEQGVATLPGAAFGLPPDALSLRLATSYVDMEDDAKAAHLLALARAGMEGATLLRDHHPALNEAIARLGAFVRGLEG